MNVSSLITQKKSEIKLEGYYKKDIWNIKEHISFSNLNRKQLDWYKNNGVGEINFARCENINIKTEIKYYCCSIIEHKINLITFNSYIKTFNVFFQFINNVYPLISTILEIEREEFINRYRKYIQDNNEQSLIGTQKRIGSDMNKKEYLGNSIYVRYIISFYDFIYDYYSDKNVNEIDKDKWDVRNLPIKVDIPITRPRYTINFKDIKQEEIRKLSKKFTYERLKTKSFNTCIGDLKGIKLLSKYLQLRQPNIDAINEINRDIIEDFMCYVRTESHLESRTVVSRIGSLKTFFDVCKLMNWDGAPIRTLITTKDYSSKVKVMPRFFDDNELKQINDNMSKLPIQIARMLFVIENVGMRVSDLCILNKNCIFKDTKGEYLINYYQVKTKSYNKVPISLEVAKVIEEAIKHSESEFGRDVEYVFSQTKDKPIATETFSYHLNKLAYDNKILDRKGDILRIESHSFRGTVATKYSNLGLSLNVIRMLLGQKSTGSLKHYVEIHDITVLESMKNIIEYQNELIGNIGNVNDIKPILEENKHLIPLPNGACGKPISEGKCTHANACYSCRMFKANRNKLELYKYHLNEAKKNIEIAKINGFERILQVNKELEENLTKIISKIEEDI